MKTRFISTVNPRVNALIAGRGCVMPFRELSREAQYAFIHYMAIDGEAWELPDDFWHDKWSITKMLSKALSFFLKKYGDVLVGYAEIPTKDLLQSINDDPDTDEKYSTFEEQRTYYIKKGKDYPNYSRSNRWPVILSGFTNETLQDGWHRFGAYVRDGAKIIPALFYPKSKR